ncbi:MAG TPA: short-chain fatty acyl-CoA regulator family protein [Gammaproteobacteria bacterium]|nr:short-chain fatty acyl-CoA regulator family protein [Gammaproteobacteria bacterium]
MSASRKSIKRNILGPRIRERRRELGVTQADVARQVEISASYLNLIEHNKRDIGGALLRKVAEALDLPLDQLDGVADRRLLETLEEIAQNPELRALGVEGKRIGELIGRFPGWARGIVALSRSEHQATHVAQVLGDRLNHDPFLGETVHKMLTRIASLYSASEIVDQHPDLEQDRRQRFYAIIHEESHHLSELGDALASYFDNAAWARRRLTPQDEVDELFDSRDNHFAEIEVRTGQLHALLPEGNTTGRIAASQALVENRLDRILRQIVSEDSRLETEMARARTYKTLFRYAVAAVVVPMDAFKQRAEILQYDIERLAQDFGVDFELICERLSALPVDDDNPRFGYYQANASGNIIRSRNLPGLAVPRYGSACPLWILYRAQQVPHTVLRQQVQLPSGESFVLVARATSTGAAGFGEARHYITDMCVISDTHARQTVYAPDRTTAIEPVGLSCRTCPRRSCKHRVIDPLTG